MKHMFTFFEDFTEGADFYQNNESLWLIFTEQKKWVFELTKDGTLWYNYYFFDKIFSFASLGLIENQNYITQWVESVIRDRVSDTREWADDLDLFVEHAIQNGVKRTDGCQIGTSTSIEDAIQNGVKQTHLGGKDRKIDEIKDIIENGVKETTPGGYLGSVEMKGRIVHQFESPKQNNEVEDTIQNGVKHTEYGDWLDGDDRFNDIIKNGVKHTGGLRFNQLQFIEDAIQNGVKETKMEEHHRLREVVRTVKDGVKETNPHFLEILNPINFEPVIKEMKRMNEVNIVFDKGIKEVKELPDKSGELRGYGDYYYRQVDRTKPHTKYVDDVITNGIKKTKPMDEWVNTDRILDGVIRDGIKETWGYEKQSQMIVNEVIKNGTKENPS